MKALTEIITGLTFWALMYFSFTEVYTFFQKAATERIQKGLSPMAKFTDAFLMILNLASLGLELGLGVSLGCKNQWIKEREEKANSPAIRAREEGRGLGRRPLCLIFRLVKSFSLKLGNLFTPDGGVIWI